MRRIGTLCAVLIAAAVASKVTFATTTPEPARISFSDRFDAANIGVSLIHKFSAHRRAAHFAKLRQFLADYRYVFYAPAYDEFAFFTYSVITNEKIPEKKPEKPKAESRPQAGPKIASLDGLVKVARSYVGKNPTKFSSLWCADFANFVLARAGYPTTNSRAARSFLAWRHIGPKVGAIAVFSRGGSGTGHVGIVTGWDKDGDVVIVSGNAAGPGMANVVYEYAHAKSRLIAYVEPPVHTQLASQ